MKLKDKIVLVTGGCRGIGKAICVRLVNEGATVIINFRRSQKSATETRHEIEAGGATAITIRADVSNSKEVDGMVATIIDQFGRIDILVNNAGVTKDSLLLTMDDSDLHVVMNTNFGGVFNCTKAVAKPMMLQGKGTIINISSVLAEKARKGHSNYAASKGAINAFTRAMAFELGSKGITVNAVSPGLILTDMTKDVREMIGDDIASHIALCRLGSAEDVAALVAFLASEDASYITGQVIKVDGGLV